MGMYTELNIGVEFKEDLPPEFVEVLEYLTNFDYLDDWQPKVKHSLFNTERWRRMLFSASYYFDAKPHSEFVFDKISNSWFLTCVFNMKNYDSEIELFLDFIVPQLSYREKTFIGYKRYEADIDPTLLYVEYGKLIERVLTH